MNETLVNLPLSPERQLHLVSQKLFGHTVMKSATFLSLHLRDQNLQCFPRNRRSASGTGEVTCLPSRDRVSFVPEFVQIPSLLQQLELVDLVLQILCLYIEK